MTTDHHTDIANRLKLKTLRISYNHCGLCGRSPKQNEEPNYAPVRWWDADDGWKITTLCSWCYGDTFNRKPKPEDFAFRRTNEVCDDCNTDEDPSMAL